ncbi:MAG: hypothetical protein K0Q48_689 [Bacillota bacterium]|jgi:CarD family transcriptional regulator|nr:hypothetical protein [Bacillota bacterium]
MFQTGDYIIYGSSGVYKVESVGKLNLQGTDQSRVYYSLSSVHKIGKIYTPTDANVPMRPLITYEDAQQLISSIPSISPSHSPENNYKSLSDHYNKLLLTGCCVDLIKLLKTIYLKNEQLLKQGKPIRQVDSKFMKKAEDLLYSELSVVLGISRENISASIGQRLEMTKDQAAE